MNYLQHPMQNPEDISNPTNALNIALKLMAKNVVQNVGHLVGQNAVQKQVDNNTELRYGIGIKGNPIRSVTTIEERVIIPTTTHKAKENRLLLTFSNQLHMLKRNLSFMLLRCLCKKLRDKSILHCRGIHCSKHPHLELSLTMLPSITQMDHPAEQYTELLEPIPEPHQVQQNDSNVISEVSSVEQGGGTVEQHPATHVEETRKEKTRHPHLSEQRTPPKVFPKVSESNALSKPVTSNSALSSRESTVVNNERVIAHRQFFRINPFKASMVTARKKNQSANVSKSANQKKHKANVKKSKKSGSKESLASPSKPRSFLRWLPTGRIFDLCGKITSSSNTESESDTSVCDNASASNPQEPTNKGFPSSTSFLGRFSKLRRQNSCIYPLAVF
ncbi:hypothetical protein Tco_0826092 [Tanacetum coccineum]